MAKVVLLSFSSLFEKASFETILLASMEDSLFYFITFLVFRVQFQFFLPGKRERAGGGGEALLDSF
jgi:hypothetical protein